MIGKDGWPYSVVLDLDTAFVLGMDYAEYVYCFAYKGRHTVKRETFDAWMKACHWELAEIKRGNSRRQG